MSAVIEADVAVVGAGPAGLAAAWSAAAAARRRVVVVDQAPWAGGQIWRRAAGQPAPRGARAAIARCERAGVRFLQGAEVIDGAPRDGLTVITRDGAVRVAAPDLVLATGARELFLPFPGWTLPNVLGVGGLQALVKGGFGVRGKRVVVAGTGPLLLPVAATLAAAGAKLVIVAEQTTGGQLRNFALSLWRTPGQLAQAALLRSAFLGSAYRTGTWVTRADGDAQLREVTLTDGRREWREPCDLLACGYGLVPNSELARLLGCRVDADGIVVGRGQGTSVRGVFAAGECTGIAGADAAIAAGARAGTALDGGRAVEFSEQVARSDAGSYRARLAFAFALRPELRALAAPDTVLCRCEDVRFGALAGSEDAREAKLLARVGMGACQGRVCGAALEFVRGWTPGAVRAPLFPAPVSALARLAPREDSRE